MADESADKTASEGNGDGKLTGGMQLSKDEWNDERQFLENILCQRFDFLLVFYTLIILGAFTSHWPLGVPIVLSLGAFVSWLLVVPIARVQYRLDIAVEALRELHSEGKHHPSIATDKIAEVRRGKDVGLYRIFVQESRRKWVGYHIPFVCSSILLSAAVIAWGLWSMSLL